MPVFVRRVSDGMPVLFSGADATRASVGACRSRTRRFYLNSRWPFATAEKTQMAAEGSCAGVQMEKIIRPYA